MRTIGRHFHHRDTDGTTARRENNNLVTNLCECFTACLRQRRPPWQFGVLQWYKICCDAQFPTKCPNTASLILFRPFGISSSGNELHHVVLSNCSAMVRCLSGRE